MIDKSEEIYEDNMQLLFGKSYSESKMILDSIIIGIGNLFYLKLF